MRLDKYLKVSRIIKRRTVAKDACDGGRVLVNGKAAKAGIDIKVDDVIEIQYANKSLKYKVLAIAEHVRKEDASKMYEIVG